MATGNLGNLTVGLILNTDKFSKGAKNARKDLFGVKSAAMDLKKFFVGGFIGAVGFNSFSSAIKKGIKAIKDDMDDLGKFSLEEQQRIIALNKSVENLQKAWADVAKTVTIAVLPALSGVAKRINEMASQLKLISGGDTRSGRATKSLIEMMPSQQFAQFQASWHAAQSDEDKMRAFLKAFGPEAGGLRVSEVFRAVQARIDRPSRGPQSRGFRLDGGGFPMLDMAMFNARMFHNIFNQPSPVTEASLGQISRLQSLVDSMDIAGNAPRERERRRRDEMVGGLSALEKGTAAAFSAEKRGQQITQQLEVARKSLKQEEEQTKALQSIDRNLKTTAFASEAANLA